MPITYDRHLSPFGALIVLVAEALSHDTVDPKVTPKKYTHFTVLAENSGPRVSLNLR